MKQALQKVSFIPFSYIIDKWRWSVFKGDTQPDDYNNYWWELRKKYQGVIAPKVEYRKGKSKELFDAGTFFHVAHNTEYLRYFLSHVLQFQFHKALCDEAGIRQDYHKCSIYKSKKAGKKLRYIYHIFFLLFLNSHKFDMAVIKRNLLFDMAIRLLSVNYKSKLSERTAVVKTKFQPGVTAKEKKKKLEHRL